MPKKKDVFHTQEGKTFFRLFSDNVDYVCQQGLKKKGSWIFYKQTRKTVTKLKNFSSKKACVRAAEKVAYR